MMTADSSTDNPKDSTKDSAPDSVEDSAPDSVEDSLNDSSDDFPESFTTPPSDDFTPPPWAAKSTEQLSLFVVLDGYEGPIDLLLTLAREQKVDLSHIAILPLAEQYLAYIQSARDLDIEVAADYLVMAAWLTYLKSRLLLPDPEPLEHEEAVDMAAALKFQLLRLEAMQNASRHLMGLPRLGQERFANGQPEEFATTIHHSLKAGLVDLLRAYGHIASGRDGGTLTITSTRLYSVEDAVKRLSHLLSVSPGWATLQNYLPEGLETPLDHRSALAAHFTASLELVRDGTMKLRQDNAFGPIWVANTRKKQA